MSKAGRADRLKSGRWRARWTDHTGFRHSETYTTEAEALAALEERRLGELASGKGAIRLVGVDALARWIDQATGGPFGGAPGPGWVLFVQVVPAGPVHVAHGHNAIEHLAALQDGSWAPLQLIGFEVGDEAAAEAQRARLAPLLLRGRWYRIGHQVRRAIARVNAGELGPPPFDRKTRPKLTPAERSAVAKAAARKRWATEHPPDPEPPSLEAIAKLFDSILPYGCENFDMVKTRARSYRRKPVAQSVNVCDGPDHGEERSSEEEDAEVG